MSADGATTGEGDVRTLWVGDLGYWVTEPYLLSCFAHFAPAVFSAKIIRNKHTGYSEGYGFVEFRDRVSAERALRSMNGVPMPGARGRGFRLNWASFGVGSVRSITEASHSNASHSNDIPGVDNDGVTSTAATGAIKDGDGDGDGDVPPSRAKETASEHSAFVGDLPPEVNDFALQETFAVRYKSVRNARVVTDPRTGRSKGFGFVRFSDEKERDAALVEMHGAKCGSRAMRLSLAVPRKRLETKPSMYPGPRPMSFAPSLDAMSLSGSSTPAGGLSTPGDGSPERVFRGGARVKENETTPSETETDTGSVDRDNNATSAITEGSVTTTVFVGGLDPSVRETDLSKVFEPIGALVYVKIPRGKGCGFAQFLERASAEKAIATLNGARVGNAGSKMRLSWVRSNGSKNSVSGSNRRDGSRNVAPYFVDQYGGYVPGGMMTHVPGMNSIPGISPGMEFGAPAYFPAPGGGWMTPGGGWVPAPPPGSYGQTVAQGVDGESFQNSYASSEEAYAFAQQQYFAAQQRLRYETAAFYGGAGVAESSMVVSTDGQSADSALAPPPTPPGAKQAAGKGAAA